MSAALINRSLTNIRTELEFLVDSEVIDSKLYEALVGSLPQKYAKDMDPWGLDKLPGTQVGGANQTAPVSARLPPRDPPDSAEKITESLALTSILDTKSDTDGKSATTSDQGKLAYCKATYDYISTEPGDLSLSSGDKIVVVEKLSPDWWKGYKQGTGIDSAGVFPTNYITVISESEFHGSGFQRNPPPVSEKLDYGSTPSLPPQSLQPTYGGYQQSYSDQPYQLPPYQQSQYQPQYQQSQYQQPQYPPQSQYQMQPYQNSQQYQPQNVVQEQPQQSKPQKHSLSGGEHLKKFGSKLGNAAIFGAGATIGSDLVHKIF